MLPVENSPAVHEEQADCPEASGLLGSFPQSQGTHCGEPGTGATNPIGQFWQTVPSENCPAGQAAQDDVAVSKNSPGLQELHQQEPGENVKDPGGQDLHWPLVVESENVPDAQGVHSL